jgi:glutathione S-transferase
MSGPPPPVAGLIWIFLVISLALALYTVTIIEAARQRRRSGIKSPATSGDVMLERALRVQQNTLEQLVVLVPAALIFALVVSSGFAAVLGLIWLAGRALYIRVYMRAPDSRGPAFVIAFSAQNILIVGDIIGTAVALLRSL